MHLRNPVIPTACRKVVMRTVFHAENMKQGEDSKRVSGCCFAATGYSSRKEKIQDDWTRAKTNKMTEDQRNDHTMAMVH